MSLKKEKKSIAENTDCTSMILESEKGLVKKKEYENLYKVFNIKDFNAKLRNIYDNVYASSSKKYIKTRNWFTASTYRKRNLKVAVITALVAVNAVLMLSGLNIRYNVYMNKQLLGTVQNKQDALMLLDKASKELSAKKKVEIFFDDAITYKPVVVLKSSQINTDEIIRNLEAKGLYKFKGYAICVNDLEMTVVQSRQMAEELLEKLKEPYKNPGTNVEFAEKVEIKEKALNNAVSTSFDEALKSLQKSSQQPKIYKVQKGDTLWIIARNNNLSVDKIMEMNPGLTERIKEGQEILLDNPTPIINIKVTNATTLQNEDSSNRNNEQNIVAVNTKPKKLTTGSFSRPIYGAITSRFGRRWGRMHEGIDIKGNIGDPIRSSDGGKVIFAGTESGYGKLIKIEHDNGFTTYYGHCSKILVTEGESVSKGEIIGKVGNTGNTTGPHLHFEVRKNGVPQNPSKYL